MSTSAPGNPIANGADIVTTMARIAIVGAGIGGLCAARAATLAGHEPVVFERAVAGTAVGAGLLLWPNAVRALDALGCGDAVRAVAVPAERAAFRDSAGRALAEIDVGALARREGVPMVVVERPALHGVLADGLAIRGESLVRSVDANGVILAAGERVEADVVIGADGIGSVVRDYVCAGCAPWDTGRTVVRGIADHEMNAGEGFEAWGRGEIVGGAALPAGRSYWFYEAPSDRIDRDDPASVITAGDWPDPIPALVAATDPRTILVNRIQRLPELRTWTRGPVALLGDAAHAMEPNLGQGAAQAIEDAQALLLAFGSHDDVTAALGAYEVKRRRRAHMFQRESSRVARLALSNWAGPRNALMRLMSDGFRLRMMERLLHRHVSAT